MAGALAVALGAEKIVYLTDVEGLLADVDDPDSPDLPPPRPPSSQAMVDSGSAVRRHDPEDRGVPRRRARRASAAHILDGRVPHVLLLELFTDSGIGTMVQADDATEPEADPDA